MENKFTRNVLFPFVYRWNLFYKGIHNPKNFEIVFSSRSMIGIFRVKENGRVDFITKNNFEDKQYCFWMNFMANKKDFHRNLSIFFECLIQSNSAKKDIREIGEGTKKVRRILIGCSTGLSASYFAFMMNKVLKRNGISMRIEGAAISDIEKYVHDFDVVLIAPQEASHYEEYLKYGNNILLIR